MKDNLEWFNKIQELESQDRQKQAQVLRESALSNAQALHESESLIICDKLAREKLTIRGIEAAAHIEPFYRRLYSFLTGTAGKDHPVAALAARKLAGILVIQGQFVEAVDLAHGALGIFERNLPEYSFEAVEAIHSVSGWSQYIDAEKNKALEAEIWTNHPLCEHLRPVEELLQRQQVRFWQRKINTGNELGLAVKLYVDAWLDLGAIKSKLMLNDCLENFEYRDRDGDGRGFRCTKHLHLIEGLFEPMSGKPVVQG